MKAAPTAADYHHYVDPIDHILARPDIYVGTPKRLPIVSRVLLTEDDLPIIREATISVPEALERLFVEIMSNAGDNVDRTRLAGKPIGNITVRMDTDTIEVTNGGLPIPVEIHPEYKIYVPELIFGNLRSGSNYDDSQERMTAGVNGLGAKLCNVFSTVFSVEVGDENNRLQYVQTWQDHMKVRGEPKITPFKGKSFVKITYCFDKEYFKMPEGYDDETFALFSRHAIDISFTNKVPVIFNEVTYNFSSISDYTRLYFPHAENMLTHSEWPINRAVELTSLMKKNFKVMPLVEICLIDTPEEGQFVAFANGLYNRDGGVHVQAAYTAVSGPVLAKLNEQAEKRKTKSKDSPEKKRKVLTLKDIKPHLSVVVSCRVDKPSWDSQSKHQLKAPVPRINVPEKTLSSMMKWDLVTQLNAALDAKDLKLLTKTDGKKRRHVNLPKLKDANYVAHPTYAKDCTLFITEGDSALDYAIKARTFMENGQDYVGGFPLKGKPLNVMGLSINKLSENKEFAELKQALGLEESLDYKIEANYNRLRYGRLVILTDADDDGLHIMGLVLNYFYCCFRSLLERGDFIMYLMTPIIRVWKGAQKMKFYTNQDFEAWKVATADWSKWKKKYYKGLGTSNASEIQEDFDNPRFVTCLYDDTESHKAFKLAFDKKLADDRKRWIAQYSEALGVAPVIQEKPISDFLNNDFVKYSFRNVQRSLPRLSDGLKESQRKILHAVYLKWGSDGRGWVKDVVTEKVNEIKVAQFGGYVTEKTAYKHGEQSIFEAMIHMAQDFVGTNNMPYLIANGNFGSRDLGPKKSASPRYINTKPQWWLPYVFKDDDLPLLDYVVDEEHKVEPRTFLPILPMCLINGAQGIGTGHSTFIPNFHPLHLLGWIIAKISGEPLPDLKPWYRGFTGKITVAKRDAKRLEDDEPVEEPEEEADPELDLGEDNVNVKAGKMSMVVYGKFHKVTDRQVNVTELPIGRWTHPYLNWLKRQVDEKKITDYKDYSTFTSPNFQIFGCEKPTYGNLQLVRSFGMSNMVLLDLDDRPIVYETVADILEAFYALRLPQYEKRRLHKIEALTADIEAADLRARFIKTVAIDQTLEIRKRKRSELEEEMRSLGFPKELLTEVATYHYTQDEIDKLRAKIQGWEKLREWYQSVPAEQLWVNDLSDFQDAYVQNEARMNERTMNGGADIKKRSKK